MSDQMPGEQETFEESKVQWIEDLKALERGPIVRDGQTIMEITVGRMRVGRGDPVEEFGEFHIKFDDEPGLEMSSAPYKFIPQVENLSSPKDLESLTEELKKTARDWNDFRRAEGKFKS